jgi:mannose-6-phosphate isomerase-like protein (cupin superfamily)
MHITNRAAATSYVTKDSSLIREIIHPQHSPASNQSLAEATVQPGRMTQAHFHTRSEEIYYILQGQGRSQHRGRYEYSDQGRCGADCARRAPSDS